MYIIIILWVDNVIAKIQLAESRYVYNTMRTGEGTAITRLQRVA
jgi:hypothetical protein